MNEDEQYMLRCLELAKLGIGNVAPNPLVGSVVVHENKIIGEGYHQKYGEAHAEVNAINAVIDKSLLKNSTLYVNLEPCSHYGKTPPCSNLIVEKKIKRVVIGCIDSFSEVSGKGIEYLKKNGVDVSYGVLEKESRELNKRFFTFHEKKRPYIILKWAQSSNGFIDINRSENSKGIFWITEEDTKLITHRWRHEEAAILVGWKTIANDNPSLTCRNYRGNNPIRIVIDQDLKLDYTAFNVGKNDALTYIFTKRKAHGNSNLKFINPTSFEMVDILNSIYALNIQSVIVEGGKQTLLYFLQNDIWDEARVLTGANKIEVGSVAPKISQQPNFTEKIGNDILEIYNHD